MSTAESACLKTPPSPHWNTKSMPTYWDSQRARLQAENRAVSLHWACKWARRNQREGLELLQPVNSRDIVGVTDAVGVPDGVDCHPITCSPYLARVPAPKLENRTLELTTDFHTRAGVVLRASCTAAAVPHANAASFEERCVRSSRAVNSAGSDRTDNGNGAVVSLTPAHNTPLGTLPDARARGVAGNSATQ